jgi:hypothetical protein
VTHYPAHVRPLIEQAAYQVASDGGIGLDVGARLCELGYDPEAIEADLIHNLEYAQ